MAESSTTTSVSLFAGLWFWMFVIIKVGGTAFAHWSWWWIFIPIVPDLVLIFHKLGLL